MATSSSFSNLFTLLFTLFPLPCLLLEGFGAGAYSAAVVALLAYRATKQSPFPPHASLLVALGGVSMPHSIFSQLVGAHSAIYHSQIGLRHLPTSQHFTHALLIVQHVHDRMAPWRLTEILLNYLYNRGVKILTLHDNLAEQRSEASHPGQQSFEPRSLFGRYRHDYQRVVPTLKTFAPSTFFANFLSPTLRPGKVLLVLPTVRISLICSPGSFLTWVLSPLSYLAPGRKLWPQPLPMAADLSFSDFDSLYGDESGCLWTMLQH